VLIKGCHFSTGDDCIAIKAGRDHDGRHVNIPCENVVVQDCDFAEGHGGVTVGSETAGGVRNVFAENCQFDSLDLDQAMRFKTNPTRGGFIENIFIRNCNVNSAHYGIYITMRYGAGPAGTQQAMPVVRNIDIRDCTFGELSKYSIYIEGWSDTAQITDVTVADCRFQTGAQNNFITNAARINLMGNHE